MDEPAQRLFIALPVPVWVQLPIENLIRQMESDWKNVTWKSQESLHITVKFLGDTSGEMTPAASRLLERICLNRPPFTLELSQLGRFAASSDAGVLWVGIHDAEGSLANLHTEANTAATRLGFPTETRPYTPHITIGNLVEGDQYLPEGEPRRHAWPKRMRWNAHRVLLLRTRREEPRESAGSRYEVLAQAELAGGEGMKRPTTSISSR